MRELNTESLEQLANPLERAGIDSSGDPTAALQPEATDGTARAEAAEILVATIGLVTVVALTLGRSTSRRSSPGRPTTPRSSRRRPACRSTTGSRSRASRPAGADRRARGRPRASSFSVDDA
ncbi:hypothetical protein HBB16_06975 [Pseudonocardia sp. MCCB 268]|nr:hypothetical protein [Pseudonocardia cytotoxica]